METWTRTTKGLLLLTGIMTGDFAKSAPRTPAMECQTVPRDGAPTWLREQIIALTDGVVPDDRLKTLPAAINVVTDEPGGQLT